MIISLMFSCYNISVKKIVVSVFLVLIFTASSWALFNRNFFRVHDYTHAARISEMALALQDGHFPVRWSKNFGFGFGMPLFEFYAPLPFYMGAFFYWLGLDVVFTLKLLFIICNLGTLLGGYKLGSKLFGLSGGILTSAALTLAPYRAVNLFVRGALSEAFAIMALPWILLGIVKVIQKEKNAFKMLVAGLVVLMLSHNITTLIFLPISVLFGFGYLLIYLNKNQQKLFNNLKTIYKLAGSYLLAVGLSAFYIFPAFIEKNYTKVEQFILGNYFDYHLHFLYIRQFFNSKWGFEGSGWGVDDNISFFLGFGQLLVLGLLAFILIRKILSNKINLKHYYLVFLLGFLAFLSAFMSILKSQPIWDLIDVLKYVQFPWRFMGVLVVFLSLLVGSFTIFIKTKPKRFLLSWILVLFILLSNFYYFRPEKFLTNNQDFYYTDPVLIQKQMSGVLQDYIPIDMNLGLEGSKHQLIFNTNELPENSIDIVVNRTHEKLLKTNFKEHQLLVLGLANYPNWRIQINDQRWTKLQSKDGLIEIEVPKGERLISIWLDYTPVWLISDIISLVSLLIFASFYIKEKHA
jgi:hypothetical protein